MTLRQSQLQPSFVSNKLEGLKRRTKKQTKIDFILQIEKLLTDYRYSTYSMDRIVEKQNKLFTALDFTVKKKADTYYRYWKAKGIDRDSFLSSFYDTTWKLSNSYEWYGDFYFYETLLLAINRTALNVIKSHTRTNKRQVNNNLYQLDNATNTAVIDDMEGDILVRVLIGQLLDDPLFTDKEKQLFIARYNNPNASQLELARILGYSHHEPIRRLLANFKNKFKKNYIFL